MQFPSFTTCLPLLLLLLAITGAAAGSNEVEEWFFSHCPRSSKCGDLEVRFPLRLNTSQAVCGLEGLVLSCSADQAYLTLRPSLSLKVTAIDYSYQLITIDTSGFWPPCPLRDLRSTNLSNEFFSVDGIRISLINCSKEFKFDPQNDSIARPGDCFNGSDRFVYVVGEMVSLDLLPSDCVVIATGGEIGYGLNSYSFRPFQSFVDAYFAGSKTRLQWSYSEMSSRCSLCESNGNHCGLDHASNSTFCFGSGNTHSSLVKLIAGLAAGVLVIVMILGFTFFFISRKAKKRRELRMKVEMFLASYKTTKPARYTYAGIKKITNRFKYKLGEGGFGSVYKGELPNGIPVAVKMLEETKSEGDDFINEVGTIGRIHHINIVRLLGFCSEGTRRALVYEFMPNESLEKYIFSRDANGNRLFGMDKLLCIAIGIARGVEYLHQGCDQRILHFDIKPHNILLDYDFNPKISDFGLAKLCSRDQSIVTMTAIRGTMGYIAPEIYSRNFGTVSYKSDVYSFGMLLLEMVGGRKNIDPLVDNQSAIYLPEWVYEQLIGGHSFQAAIEMMNNEEEIVRKLVIVALWCIQWNPNDRPTMTRVVQMLIGSLESLEIPPRPFVSSSDQDEDETSFKGL
ncbi:Glycerophosphodiester phosphodiesterase protein [Dioscorea alata]|uniref:Glycerophosphodiester phosphodiesterase protein n=1 Tax=Dioscorea alata TaxID=55571 RepID=A0ACB7UE39_DIOAL|nr:Glycerophosphodiester phosphodiesterase protein [Dioscorea alata]